MQNFMIVGKFAQESMMRKKLEICDIAKFLVTTFSVKF